MFRSVDLPAPFSPSSACTSPGRRSKSTRSSATTPGNRFVMPRISRTVAASTAHDSKDLLLKRRGDLEPARDDLLPDLVHLVDEHPWHRGIDLAHAHAAVRKGELQVLVAFELAPMSLTSAARKVDDDGDELLDPELPQPPPTTSVATRAPVPRAAFIAAPGFPTRRGRARQARPLKLEAGTARSASSERGASRR